MPVIDARKDTDNLTLTMTSEFDAPVDRVWQLWADPRQLERWWGPPTYPATVTHHELTVGGGVEYFMTGPEGDKHGGWWKVVAVDPPTSLEFVDGFAKPDGTPNTDLPNTSARVSITPLSTADNSARTQMVVKTQFLTIEQMEQLVAMHMVEGFTEALGQIDAILAEE